MFVEFPAGILQGKFFDAVRPKYMNYAAIGSIVGHEITHGFDDLGRQFDINGNLVEWWGEETRQQFLVKANCIIDQYGNFTEPKTKLNVSIAENCVLENKIFLILYFSISVEWQKYSG